MAEKAVHELLLDSALRDAAAFRALCVHPEVHASAIGFHAQQAVEKSLKAVLAHARVQLRRTRDVAELLDLITDRGLAPPPFAERPDELRRAPSRRATA